MASFQYHIAHWTSASFESPIQVYSKLNEKFTNEIQKEKLECIGMAQENQPKDSEIAP